MLCIACCLGISGSALVTLVKHTPSPWTITLRFVVLLLLFIYCVKCLICILTVVKWHRKHEIILKYRCILFNVIIIVIGEKSIMLVRIIESTGCWVRSSCKAVILNINWLISCDTIASRGVIMIAVLKTLIATTISSICELVT